MTSQNTLTISAPSLPKGGGAIQSIGKGLGPVGTQGTATAGIELPISSGRGFSPALTLGYSSHAGNDICGMGWSLSRSAISRYTRKGVPNYSEDDLFAGPDGEMLMPVRDEHDRIERRSVDSFRSLDLQTSWHVARYQPRIRHSHDVIEHWRSNDDDPGFWMIHGSDGSLHVYGLDEQSRITAPDGQRVAQWLLQESMNAHGEHIVYEYKQEDGHGVDPQSPRDFVCQRYLSRVCYGNRQATPHLYAWGQSTAAPQWHFELLFDYGERATGLAEQPGYPATGPWPLRSDPFSSYVYGFELRTWRLCRQVLMFHHFPDDTGPEPVLVQRLSLEYQTTDLSYSQLQAAHLQGYDARGQVDCRPPMEFGYSGFDTQEGRFEEFQHFPGLDDGQRYQLVDLYGEGLPGVLYRSEGCWYYREPQRAAEAQNPDQITYGDWQTLPRTPAADQHEPVNQSLTDITGNGRLDWVVSQHGLQGFFTLGADRQWSGFTPFSAFPSEFFHTKGQMADLIGDGLSDLTLIGNQSVRLYRSTPRQPSFESGTHVDHDQPGDYLPTLNDSHSDVVAFSDVLGSGQQHLVRIRHNEIKCWPNLGHGKFGRGFRLAELPFSYDEFEASRVLLADLDGSGAADLIYLTPDHIQIFMNNGGNGFDQQPRLHSWPQGMRYDRFCQVSAADVQGLGCSSLIVTSPHPSPRHWRCDFVSHKPYLLVSTQNNMGASSQVTYRSSAQEWLDEKQELRAAGNPAHCQVPLAIHLASQQWQIDEITGNRLTQQMRYRQGYYDGHEREIRGYGLLLQTDSGTQNAPPEAHEGAPLLTKSWFHTGRFADLPESGHDASETNAWALGQALLLNDSHQIISPADEATQREMARALSGVLLRVETFGLDGSDRQDLPYGMQQHRHAVVLERARSNGHAHAIMRPLLLESVTCQYERQPDDPRCQHLLHLQWDRFDTPTHSVNVSYARRKTPQDEPPFDEEHERTWWWDTHDPAQANYHVDETRAEFIHLSDADYLRLGLPYRERRNALLLAADELTPQAITFEVLRSDDSPLNRMDGWVLTGMAEQRYKRPLPWDDVLESGQATYQALAGYLETAELDEAAVQVYDSVLPRAELEQRLIEDGYRSMPSFLPADATALWAVRKGFVSYATDAGFNHPVSIKAVEHQGATTLDYDAYQCLTTRVTTADGCQTQAQYDYRLMLPIRIIDPNANTHEALYDGFGAVRASSFHGTELGLPAGFAPMEFYYPADMSPGEAIKRPEAAVQGAAAAHFSDTFAWMGKAPDSLLNDANWLAEQVAARNLLPSGHIRQSARRRLTSDPASAQWVSNAAREPVYAVSLQADRYPDDPEPALFRISSISWDGFGRTLQSRQKVEPGQAWHISADGTLTLRDGQPINVETASRWRISERVEYNHKGLAIRIYRPFFADYPGYIDDSSLRIGGIYDRQYYDPTGRMTLTITAKDLWRRESYLPWYTISEDENDTFEEAMAAQTGARERAS